jgi:hypothetical protein
MVVVLVSGGAVLVLMEVWRRWREIGILGDARGRPSAAVNPGVAAAAMALVNPFMHIRALRRC